MGGSGSSGGSSGSVDYPGYMKDRHSWLFSSMQVHAADAAAKNPWVGMQAYDPNPMQNSMAATVQYYDDIIFCFDPIATWQQVMGLVPTVVLGLLDNAELDALIDDQQDRIYKRLEDEILPKYRRGMQDVGAVMTSAFKIGEALLWARGLEEASAAERDLKGKLAIGIYDHIFTSADELLKLVLQKISYQKDVVHYNLETLRMAYAAQKEYTDSMNTYKVESVRWPLEIDKYLMDSLGSISGSAGTSYSTSSAGTSKVASAIGGALSGAATGAAVGGPWGAAIGGAVGLAASMFM